MEAVAIPAPPLSGEELDAQEWVSQDVYFLLGHPVLVRSTSVEFGAQVRHILRSLSPTPADGVTPELTLSFVVAPKPKARGIRPFHLAFSNSTQIGRTANYYHLFGYLVWQLDSFPVEYTPDHGAIHHYFLHAGAVVKNGVGIVLPGHAWSGKSTLTLALVRQGYGFLTDELVAVDPVAEEVHPFHMPFKIKDPSVFPDLDRRTDIWTGPERWVPEGTWFLHPEDIAHESLCSESVPIRYIIFPKYDPESRPQLKPLTAGQALEKLMENSMSLLKFKGDALQLLANLAENAQCFSLASNNLKETTALIDRLTDGDSQR